MHLCQAAWWAQRKVCACFVSPTYPHKHTHTHTVQGDMPSVFVRTCVGGKMCLVFKAWQGSTAVRACVCVCVCTHTGTLEFMVGGDKDALEIARPYLMNMGGSVTHW